VSCRAWCRITNPTCSPTGDPTIFVLSQAWAASLVSSLVSSLTLLLGFWLSPHCSCKDTHHRFLIWQRLSVLTGQRVLRTASKQEKQEGGEHYARL
jgi:hypothetical protein